MIAVAYLLWTWYQGEQVETAERTSRPATGAMAALGRAAPSSLSFVGRLAVLLLFAKGGGVPLRTETTAGIMIKGPSGEDLNLKTHGPESATPVLLTHGWSLDQSVWQYAVGNLSKIYRVITTERMEDADSSPDLVTPSLEVKWP